MCVEYLKHKSIKKKKTCKRGGKGKHIYLSVKNDEEKLIRR